VAEALLARFVPHRDVMLEGLAALAEFEALGALACFSATQPVRCYPDVVSDTRVEITAAVHPLIAPENAQANDLLLTGAERMWVVTGPNAAGKSTYLRMVGVNLLLAHIGAAVGARQMAFSPVRLLTDVRIRDDLAKHESYFLSEVRRLRRMIADTQTDPPLLGLIDEPFRGTNSSERTAAGVALVEHLLKSQHLFLIATHEETLARTAAQSDAAENYHFQEHLAEHGIVFDYLLRPGPAGTRTAIRILEQEGYPTSLLERARKLMDA
jgi:DNA mismatch repair ATPase MutS